MKPTRVTRTTWRWGWWAAASAGLAALVLVGVWLWPVAEPLAGGTPRLAVDRTEIDLGALPFERMVRARFTLTNVGEGRLEIDPAPPVHVVQGC